MASTIRNDIPRAVQEQWWNNPQWQAVMARVGELTSQGMPQSRAMIQARREVPGAPQPPAGYQIDDNGNLTTAGDNGIDFGNYGKWAGTAFAAGAGAAALPALFASAPAAGAGGSAGVSGAAGGAGAGAGAATGAGAAGAGAAVAGSSLPGWLPPLVSTGAKLVNSALAGRENARANQADYNMAFDRGERERAAVQNQGVGLDLQQREYLDSLYKAKTRQALQGGLLQGVEDAHVNRPSTIPGGNLTGGLRPSAIVGRKEIGADIQRQAMLELMNPTQQSSLRSIADLPPMSRPPESNGVDTGLSIAGLGLSGASLIQELMKANQQRITPPPVPGTTGETFSLPPLRLY